MNNSHLRLPQGISYSELCLGELQARPSHIYSASSLLMAVFPDVAALPDSVDSAHGHGPIPSQAHTNTDLNSALETGEMAQWLLAALPGDLGAIPNTHRTSLNCPLLASLGTAHMWHTDIHMQT